MEKSTKLLPIISLCAAVIAVIFRSFQILVTVDYNEMGFFSTDAGFFSTYGFYLFLAVAAVVFIAAVFIDSKKVKSAFLSGRDALTPKQTAAMGVSFLIAACFKFYMVVFSFKGFGMDFIGEGIIFIVFAAIGFILLGSRKVKAVTGYLMLLISVSYTLKAAALFMGDTVITRVSGELVLLLSYVSAVFFFLALGRYFSGNESKNSRHKLLIFAACSACLSACASLSGHIALLIDGNYMKDHMEQHPLSEIGVIITAFAVIFILYGEKTGAGTIGADTETDGGADEIASNNETSSV